MGRLARKRSKTGIYHIMLRGIDKRDLFLDDEDRVKFIEKIIKSKEKVDFKLYGYCLMDNHVHLLIKESEDIGISLKRITVGYVQWHNNRHGRTGHLFQNRYLSEPVETEGYLINVLRYIHQNPVKAGMVKKSQDYLWSSYNLFISAFKGGKPYVDTELIQEYFRDIKSFEGYMNLENSDECMDYKPVAKYTDVALKNIIEKDIDIVQLKSMSIENRNKVIKRIYHKTGASIRQLGRVLGIGKNVIEKAVKEDKRNVPVSS